MAWHHETLTLLAEINQRALQPDILRAHTAVARYEHWVDEEPHDDAILKREQDVALAALEGQSVASSAVDPILSTVANRLEQLQTDTQSQSAQDNDAEPDDDSEPTM